MWHSALLLMVLQSPASPCAELISAPTPWAEPGVLESGSTGAPAPSNGIPVLAETIGAGAGSIIGLGTMVAALALLPVDNGTVEGRDRGSRFGLTTLALPMVFAGAAAGVGGFATGSGTALGAALTTSATTAAGLFGGALVGGGIDVALGGGYGFGPIAGVLLGGVAGTIGGAMAGPSVHAMVHQHQNKHEVE